MLTKLSRYILVVISIMTCSITLPKLFHTTFDKPYKLPLIQYSCVNNNFISYDSQDKSRKDTQNKQYTRTQYEQALPLMYSRQLMVDGVWPDSILGVEADVHTFIKYNSFCRIKPKDIDCPKPKLYPLLESESGRVKLELPNDFFRIGWRMDFIDANSNEIDEEKSRTFSAELYHKGFQFPATIIAGIPTLLKSCDEGYFVVDSRNQLYHIKLIKTYPFIRKIKIPEGLKIKHINCVDFKDKHFYAYIISEDNSIYTINQEEYQFTKWPIKGYIPEKHELKIYSDYFNYQVYLKSDREIICYALDKDLNEVNNYTYQWTAKEDRKLGLISAAIFPFKIEMNNQYSKYIKFNTMFPNGYYWLIINILLTLIYVVMKRKETCRKNQYIDIVLIAISGIYGFISVNIFPNKFR